MHLYLAKKENKNLWFYLGMQRYVCDIWGAQCSVFQWKSGISEGADPSPFTLNGASNGGNTGSYKIFPLVDGPVISWCAATTLALKRNN